MLGMVLSGGHQHHQPHPLASHTTWQPNHWGLIWDKWLWPGLTSWQDCLTGSQVIICSADSDWGGPLSLERGANGADFRVKWATEIWVNSIVKPVLKTSNWERLHTVRVFVQAWQELPARITNVSNWDQVLAENATLGHWESVKWAAPVNGLEFKTLGTPGLCEQLQRVGV